jgi:ABC-type molybdate transport system substrate-binding protein
VPGTVAFGAGTASAASNGTTFLAASNTEPAFDFITQDFVQTANGGNSVTFSFGGSGGLAGVIDGGVDYASNGTGNSPAGDALFASADEANVDNTIPEGTAAAANTGSVPKYSAGQCVDPHSSTYSSANGGNNNGTSCPGIGSTRAQYTTGRLVIFSCRNGGKTLAPAQGAPTCAEPVRGYFSAGEAPSTMAQVWTDLLAHTAKGYGGTANHNVGGYLAIADPKNGWTFADTGCGPARVAPNAPYGLAGMEALYVAAVGYYHANPHPSLGATSSDQACAEIDRMTDKGSDLDNYNTTSPSSGGQNGNGNYSDPSLPIIFGDNVTYTQDSVVAGTSQIALLPKSFEVSPGGNDSDFWAEVPACGVASFSDASVSNGWTTHIGSAERCTDSDYVAGMHDNVASKISSRNFGKDGAASPKTLIGESGYYQPIRQWVVVENDDQGQPAATDLTSPDGKSALAFIQYLLSAKGQAVLSAFGYDPIS